MKYWRFTDLRCKAVEPSDFNLPSSDLEPVRLVALMRWMFGRVALVR